MRPSVLAAAFALAVSAAAPADEGDLALAEAIRAFEADESTIRSFHRLEGPGRFDAQTGNLARWKARLAEVEFERLSTSGRIDLLLFETLLARRVQELETRRAEYDSAAQIAPWHPLVLEVEATERDGEPFAHRDLAGRLAGVGGGVQALRDRREAFAGNGPGVRRALSIARDDAEFLEGWYGRHADAEPLFGWWLEQPATAAREAIQAYGDFLEREILPELKKTQHAFAIGAEALDAELRAEHLPYTAEELLALGERWFAEIEAEFAATAALVREGAPWKDVLAEVKADQVEVGQERAYVQATATEAIRFVRERNLMPLPPLVEKWSLVAIDRDAQKTYPFAYYSGNRMAWAYAVRSQPHEAKEAAMRGNNRHFTRTVVPHELVPGHHLQTFYAQRHRTHRGAFRSSVLVEGWGFYVELLLDEEGWFRTPRERLGHLHWKLLRAARILVSLRYHLGRIQQSEMVDFLVEKVGLEREGAQGEVDRYMVYSPLYQASYMVGAYQLRALREEARAARGEAFDLFEFHAEILEQNSIPVRLARYAVLGLEVPRRP